MIDKPRSRKKGFVSMVALILLALFAIFGTIYWLSSRSNTNMIKTESDRIKLRYFANAGIERAKLYLYESMKSGNMKPVYDEKSGTTPASGFSMEFDEGGYKIISIKPLKIESSELFGITHRTRARVIGRYDIWELVAAGYLKNSKIKAEISAILKVYKDDAVYR